jgi:hypothetical protein
MTVGIHILSFMVLWEQKHSEPATSGRIALRGRLSKITLAQVFADTMR